MIAENDPAGTGIIFKKALEKYTEHDCSLVTWQRRYVCNFDEDIYLPTASKEDWDRVEHLLKTADVFHFHMLADEDTMLGPFKISDYINNQLIVRHHHGHPLFRQNLEKYQRKYEERRDDVVIVSTPDMVDLFPNNRSIWVPNFVHLEDPRYKPKQSWDLSSKVKLSQSPTRKNIKATDALEDVATELISEGCNLELDVIEMQPHDEVLKRKRESDLVFDQMNYSFGLSSLEGLALGVPVICHLPPAQQERIAEKLDCRVDQLPWIYAQDRKTLREALLPYVEEKSGKQKLKQKGLYSARFMREFWHESKVVKHLSSLYK